VRAEPGYEALAGFLVSDLQGGLGGIERLLAQLERVERGEVGAIERSGNAYLLRLRRRLVSLHPLHDDRATDCRLDPPLLRRVLAAWRAALEGCEDGEETSGMASFEEVYRRSLEDPEGFWAEAAEAVHWYERWDKAGRAEETALIYDSPVTDTVRHYSFRQLRDETAKLAGALAARGVRKGDRVIIYMPMVPEAIMAMLACARLGAIHSVVFGGFAANELATRIDDCAPKLILSASCGIEGQRVVPYKPLLDAAIMMAVHKPERCLVLQRPQERCELMAGRDEDWGEVMAAAEPHDC
ncbi:unnamed protein product, partial [Symbiodinium necroappetens]